jgi:hypothetical protein
MSPEILCVGLLHNSANATIFSRKSTEIIIPLFTEDIFTSILLA